MIKRLCIAIVMVFAMASMAAAATVAVATGNVNLRAGPSTGYPVVVVVPVGARNVTHGCLPGYTWCDIGFGSYRGWVSARYVQVVYNGAPVVLSPAVAASVGVAVVAFNKAYWDNHYASYPWYYRGPAYYGQAARSCGPNGCSGTVTGPYGGTASGARGCGPRGCAGAGTIIGPTGGSVQGARRCGPYGCVGGYRAVGPNGGTRSGAGHFRW